MKRLKCLLRKATSFGFLITVDPRRPFEANEDDWGYLYLYRGTDADAAVSAVQENLREGVMLIWLESGADHHWVRVTNEAGGITIDTCTQHVDGWTSANSCIVRVLFLEVQYDETD